MPRTKKPAGHAIDPRNGRRADLTVVVGSRFEAPGGLCDQAMAAWEAYWEDGVSQVQTPVDRAVLSRWVTEMDRYLRLMGAADMEPVVRGSQGQPVENPMYGTAYKALAAVQACEKQMGMGALNRSALGIAVITERRSLADLNSEFGGGSVGQRPAPEVVRPDPRVIEA
jgi:P27 family predicted phage terminase small subunit